MNLASNTNLQGGKYRIIRHISSGGFGCTYEAEHIMLRKHVAIKEFFVKDFCNRDESTSQVSVGTQSKMELVQRLKRKFIEEAKALSQIDHVNIVKVHDIFEENGTAYYVMDYIKGESLGDLIKRQGTLSEIQSVKYIRQIADALSQVHSLNRLHLDVKPGNIMIDESDKALLIDFGASKQYDEVNGENTSTLLGKTPGYAPIELLGNNVQSFTPATDIYSLGATLYKCVTGITPPEVTTIISDGLPALPSSLSPEIKRTIEKSMSVKKGDRPQSMEEFLELFDGYIPTSQQGNTSKTVVSNPANDEATILDNGAHSINNSSKTPSVSKIEKGKPKGSRIVLQVILGIVVAVLGVTFLYFIEQKKIAEQQRQEQIAKQLEEQQRQEQIAKQNFYNSTHGMESGHEWVDLGLPSGTKWATCNVGASNEYDRGNYLEPKEAEWAGGQFIDYVSWDRGWRRPIVKEFKELIKYCTWTWYNQNNGKHGAEIKGPNGNTIFLPAAGTYVDFSHDFAVYWSIEMYDDDYGGSNYGLYFDSTKKEVHDIGLHTAHNSHALVRCVLEEDRITLDDLIH